MTENHLVPNSFQHPNFLVDKLDYYLTPEESKVLSKAVREILGWRDKVVERKAPIALSVFVDGKFSYNGERLCYGCGLGLQSVRNALTSLHKFGILIKVGQSTQDGQTYWLQDDESKIDWESLEARRAKRDEVNAKRTKKATEKSMTARGITSGVKGNVGREEVTLDVNTGVTPDVKKETQTLETQKDPTILPIALDGHQRAVDRASGTGQVDEPEMQVTEHLYWGYMEGIFPLPDNKRERERWRQAAKRLLLKLPRPWDIQAICQAIDEWFVSDLDDFWKGNPQTDKALDCVAKYIINPPIDSTKTPDWAREPLEPGPLPDFITS